jgi:hypothetical protein
VLGVGGIVVMIVDIVWCLIFFGGVVAVLAEGLVLERVECVAAVGVC